MSNQGQEYPCCCNPHCGCECHVPALTPSTRAERGAATTLAEEIKAKHRLLVIPPRGIDPGRRWCHECEIGFPCDAYQAADMLLELARDGERLDWLEGRLDGPYLTERFFDSDDRKALVRRWTADHRDWYDTPRAAIDAARNAAQQEKP